MCARASQSACLAVLAFILSIPAVSAAKTIYVNADASGGNDRTSWADAYTYLQDALRDVDPFGEQVEIRGAQGIYRPDQGAGEASKSYFGKAPCEVAVPGDVNGDCIIDFRDFMIMGLHWCEDNN